MGCCASAAEDGKRKKKKAQRRESAVGDDVIMKGGSTRRRSGHNDDDEKTDAMTTGSYAEETRPHGRGAKKKRSKSGGNNNSETRSSSSGASLGKANPLASSARKSAARSEAAAAAPARALSGDADLQRSMKSFSSEGDLFQSAPRVEVQEDGRRDGIGREEQGERVCLLVAYALFPVEDGARKQIILLEVSNRLSLGSNMEAAGQRLIQQASVARGLLGDDDLDDEWGERRCSMRQGERENARIVGGTFRSSHDERMRQMSDTSSSSATGGGRGSSIPPLSARDVFRHRFENDCWVTIRGVVYDLTPFVSQHPGGVHAIIQSAGDDATKVFEDAHSGSKMTLDTLKKYRLGFFVPG